LSVSFDVGTAFLKNLKVHLSSDAMFFIEQLIDVINVVGVAEVDGAL